MANINTILSNLNANYTQITDLVPDRFFFTDDIRFALDEFDGSWAKYPLGQSLLRLSNGKLIWVGASGTDTNVKNVRRFNSDYSLDSSFSAIPNFEPYEEGVVCGADEQSDGKIIIFGTCSVFDETTLGSLIRLDTDGSVDSSFNSGGSGVAGIVYAAEVLSDDSILVAGTISTYNSIAVPHIFKVGPDGEYMGPISISDIAISAGGNCEVTAGNHGLSNGDVITISDSDSQVNIDGTWTVSVVDSEIFTIPEAGVTVGGSTGTLIVSDGFDATSVVEINSTVKCFVIDETDDKIYVGGDLMTGLVRLNGDGSIDDTFYCGVGFNNSVQSLALDSDGNLLVGGGFNQYQNVSCSPGITRLITSVGPTKTITNISTSDETGAIVTCNDHGLSSDDIIIVFGSNSDVSIDGTWSVSTINPNQFYVPELGVTVAGSSGSFFKPAGYIDSTFQTEGTGLDNTNESNLLVETIAIQSDDKILLGGWFNRYDSSRQGHIIRLNTDGTRDTTLSIDFGFNDRSNAWAPTSYGGRVEKILVNQDGSILCAGDISAFNFRQINTFAKLSSTGQLSDVQLLKYNFVAGISDGDSDMYDGGNYLNTDLTQVFENVSEDKVEDSSETQAACIPMTHTSALDDDVFKNESNVQSYLPYMDGVVADGTELFGPGSSYFTNYYPGLFVLVATNISIDEFSITGDVGSDEDTVNSSFIDVYVNGKKYTAFVKTNVEDGGSDPSVNQIIIVPGEVGSITQSINNDGDDYDDHLVRGLSGRSDLYYLLVAGENAQALSEEDAAAIVEKFITLIDTSDPEITVVAEISPQLRNLGTDGSLDIFDENGNSVQRTLNGILLERNGQYKVVGNIKDGQSFDNIVHPITDFLSVKIL
jgi:uncharacterized delta-60 repeat protein